MTKRAEHLAGRAQGAWRQLWGDASQATKRAMLHLSIVPPPLRVVLDVTDSCNLRCPTCSKWRSCALQPELGLEQWQLALGKLAGQPLLREVVVSGGEPFTRGDILEILAAAKGQQFKVTVISNGWMLREALLEQLEAIGVDMLTVSLNSLSAQVHDGTRGAQGSHGRIMSLVKAWQARPRRISLSLATVVMELYVHELTQLAEFAWQNHLAGIAFQVLAPPQAHYAFAGAQSMPQEASDWHARDPLWVSNITALRTHTKKLLQLQARGCPVLNPPSQLRRMPLYSERPDTVRDWPCLGTLSRLYVDPFGDVRLCYGFPPVGNILRDDPRALWRSAAAQEVRRASRSCTRLCRMLNNNL
jgi:MoaA/NifB/PqqE/SkfB family radical SAM enzyme